MRQEHDRTGDHAAPPADVRLDQASHSRLDTIPGRPPDLVHPPQGCPFSPRCAYARDRCHTERPELTPAETPDHVFACWYPVGSPEYHAKREELARAGDPLAVSTAVGGSAPIVAGSPEAPHDLEGGS